jgi:hypothetical protein
VKRPSLVKTAATSLSASTGYVVQGGGVFNGGTITRTRGVIAGNKPDDCFGC